MSHLFSITYTDSQLVTGLISNSLYFALNLWVVLPLPTSQTFFTFTLLLCSPVLLQTPECSEYHPFAQSQVVSALSLTELQQLGINSPLPPVTHAFSVSSFKSSLKTFLFSKTFSSVHLPWGASVCQGVCLYADVLLCIYVCASGRACVCCLCIWAFDVQIYVCVR